MKHFIILIIIILITGGFFSCVFFDVCNRPEVKRMLKDFSREYTGLDTLIRTDGYYYHDDGTSLSGPFMLSNNGEFRFLYVRYKNHIEIQKEFKDNTPMARGIGHYILSGDTIKARWAEPYQLACYFIFSQQYLIVNDTTLRQIWQLCETCSYHEEETSNAIYQFYRYSVDTK